MQPEQQSTHKSMLQNYATEEYYNMHTRPQGYFPQISQNKKRGDNKWTAFMLFFKPRVHGSTAMQEPQCKQGIHRPTDVGLNLTLLQVRSCAGIPLAHKRGFKPGSASWLRRGGGAHEWCAPPLHSPELKYSKIGRFLERFRLRIESA